MKHSHKPSPFSVWIRPGQSLADARLAALLAKMKQAAKHQSRRADKLLLLLPLLLLLAGLTRCAPARTAAEAHATHAEHPAPTCQTTAAH